MDDLGAKVSFIEKIVYLLHTKTCANFGLIIKTLLKRKFCENKKNTIKFVMQSTTDIVSSLASVFSVLRYRPRKSSMLNVHRDRDSPSLNVNKFHHFTLQSW